MLRIDDPGYQDFRADASCIVRPQSLIGERFVECDPTRTARCRRRAPGRAARRSRRARARASTCCRWRTPPSRSTSTCSTTSCASPSASGSRSSSTSSASASPAAARTSTRSSGAPTRRSRRSTRSCGCSPRQNDELEQLAVDSDTIMAPLARERAHVVVRDREHRRGRRRDRRAPRGPRGRHPAAARASCASCARRWSGSARSSDEMTPVHHRPRRRGARTSTASCSSSGPFSQAAIPAFDTLGDASVVGTPAIRTATPVLQDTQTFAATRPVAKQLAAVLDLVPAQRRPRAAARLRLLPPPRSTASTRSGTTCARR